MRKYAILILIFSILLILFGFFSGKISGESFTYISIPGTFFAMLKILIVGLVLLLAIGITIPAVIMDIIVLIFTNLHFPITSNIWDISWNLLTIEWLWLDSGGSSVLFASIILIILMILLVRRKR
jgi:hypothetical protein